MPIMAIIISRMLAISSGPGFGSFDSGTVMGARARNGTSTGTAMRNTDPHQKWLSRSPPTMGPSAAPAEKPAAHTAIAVRRSFGSRKMLRMSESVAGMSMAPKNPSTARAMTSSRAVGANAASAEITANPTEPISRILRRPMRSPRLPIGTSSPASTSEYASTIQSCSLEDGSSACAIEGTANASTVLSTETSSTGSMSTVRAIHRLIF